MSDYHTLLSAALNDKEQGRLHQVQSGDLDPNTQLPGTYLTTDTFWSAWQLSGADLADKVASLSVMRGMGKEPRHPAYRTTATVFPGVYQCRVRGIILTVHIEPATPGADPLEGVGTLTWLTIHPA